MAAGELIEKEVDGHHYEFSKYNTTKSLKILTRLTKLVGEPLMIGFGELGGKGMLDKALPADLLGKIASSLGARLDEDTVINLIKELASNDVLCDGKKIVFDLHYQDRLDHLFKVVWAALEVQYGNFLGAVIGLQENLKSSSIPVRVT